ncbi:MAG: histidine phosphatase family protein [Vulcanimicrobiaceae bacterium]
MHEFSLDAGATELYLIRHADAKPHDDDTDIDVTYRDAPLSALGRSQAVSLAERCAHEGVAAIIASPSRRTLETAHYIAEATTAAVTADERLREVHIGEFDRPLDPGSGTIAGAVRARLDHLAVIALRDGGWSSIPGTEPSIDVRTRMRSAAGDAIAAHPGKRVLLVSHAGAINAYLADLLGIECDFFFPAGNTSISVVRASSTRRLLIRLNDTAHLRVLSRSA